VYLYEDRLPRRRHARFERLENRRMLDAVPQLVADLGLVGGNSQPRSFAAVGNATYFVATDNVHGAELWRTDGTASGTQLVQDLNPGNSSAAPNNLINVNGTLFFVADDGSHGRELWKSDGTVAGTILLSTFLRQSPAYLT